MRGALHFLVGLLVVGAIIVMMASSIAFRNFVIVLLLLLGGAIWLFIDHVSKEAEERRRAQQAQDYHAATAIKEAHLVSPLRRSLLQEGPS